MPSRYPSLNADNADIWRIVHRDNVLWILEHGLHCANSGVQDPNFVAIGNTEIIAGRRARDIPMHPFGTLSDYVPFYFTPFSPMMYNIVTGHGIARRERAEICIVVSSLHLVSQVGCEFLFTDRHAFQDLANFYSDLAELSNVNWLDIQNRDFQRKPEEPIRFEKYQAEALVHQHVPVEAFKGVACYDEETTNRLSAAADEMGLDIKIRQTPNLYL